MSALFDRIDQTMPAESPGILSDEQVLSVIAYLLQQNGFPAGDKTLADVKSLASVQFVAP
jgi:mono/diheme cytochrome c family protein